MLQNKAKSAKSLHGASIGEFPIFGFFCNKCNKMASEQKVVAGRMRE